MPVGDNLATVFVITEILLSNPNCNTIWKIVARIEQDDTNSMRLITDTLTTAPDGSDSFHLVPEDINVATAYRFEIDVYYNSNEPDFYVTVPGGPYTLIVGCV